MENEMDDVASSNLKVAMQRRLSDWTSWPYRISWLQTLISNRPSFSPALAQPSFSPAFRSVSHNSWKLQYSHTGLAARLNGILNQKHPTEINSKNRRYTTWLNFIFKFQPHNSYWMAFFVSHCVEQFYCWPVTFRVHLYESMYWTIMRQFL